MHSVLLRELHAGRRGQKATHRAIKGALHGFGLAVLSTMVVMLPVLMLGLGRTETPVTASTAPVHKTAPPAPTQPRVAEPAVPAVGTEAMHSEDVVRKESPSSVAEKTADKPGENEQSETDLASQPEPDDAPVTSTSESPAAPKAQPEVSEPGNGPKPGTVSAKPPVVPARKLARKPARSVAAVEARQTEVKTSAAQDKRIAVSRPVAAGKSADTTFADDNFLMAAPHGSSTHQGLGMVGQQDNGRDDKADAIFQPSDQE